MPPSITRIRQIVSRASTGREVSITYGAQTVTGLKGGVSEKSDYQIQGYREEYEFSVWIEADDFTSAPKPGRTITVDSVVRRILGVKPDSIEAMIRLDLGARYAGT